MEDKRRMSSGISARNVAAAALLLILMMLMIWGTVSFLVFMESYDPAKLKIIIVALILFIFTAAEAEATHEQRSRARIARLAGIDDMNGHDFEYWCAEYISQRGFTDVSVTRGSNDYGVDILAQLGDEKYAIQCKRCSFPVSNKAVQEVYTGKNMYECSCAAVMTNGYFSSAAARTAETVGVELWDREWLRDNALRVK